MRKSFDYNIKERSLTKTYIAKKKLEKQQRAERATMTQTQDGWSEQVWRAPRWIRKKNQSWRRTCSHRTEAENDEVFDNVGARRRSCRCWSRSCTPVARWHKRRSSGEAIWKICCEAVVAEAESAHHSNDDENAAAIEIDGRFVAEAAAALHHRILESVNYELVIYTLADWVCLFETHFFLSVEHFRQRSRPLKFGNKNEHRERKLQRRREEWKYQSSHKMKYRLPSVASEKVKPVITMESKLKTSRHATKRLKKWSDRSSTECWSKRIARKKHGE